MTTHALGTERRSYREWRCLMIDRLGFEKIIESHGGAYEIHMAALNHRMVVHFVHERETSRDGEPLLVYVERSENRFPDFVPERIVEKRVPPSCSGCGAECTSRACTGCAGPMLAKALFRTNKEAIAFVESVADHVYWPSYDEADISFGQLEDAWAIAWGRNEKGLRTACEAQASELMTVLREMPVPLASVANSPKVSEGSERSE